MQSPKVLFISHPEQQCGVYQFGSNVAAALRQSARYQFLYQECTGRDDLLAAVGREQPAAIIYNYHPLTMPWLTDEITGVAITVPQIGIFHEVTQAFADAAGTDLFDYHIAPDPTLESRNPRVFKTGRLLPDYVNEHTMPETLTVGCFGFGTVGKGFDRVITQVQREFDRAIIRMHLPFAAFGDSDGGLATAFAQGCRELILKPGIELHVTHHFMSQVQLLDFLAANSLNCFFYASAEGRGISSVLDYALAVHRPIAISRSTMFRHVSQARPSICVDDSSLQDILAHGVTPLRPFINAWSSENLMGDYERIMAQILDHPLRRDQWRGRLAGKVGRKVRHQWGRIARRVGGSRVAPAPPAAR